VYGAFILAEAGLLDGRRATAHWAFARELQTRFPKITVEEDRIFIVDGPVWTSAGATAALDLALAMVEKDLGPDVARSTARLLVMHHRRAGGQSQHSELRTLSPKSDRIQNAIAFAEKHLEVLAADLSRKADLSRVEDALKNDSSITMPVNNAGIGTFARLLDSDANKMEDIIFLNITALSGSPMPFAPRFVARGTGTIINISSVAGIAPELLNGVYGGSKAYVLAFSLSLQHELALKGICIQTVLPGAISTEF
jgi:NAD(P)-dependent dehydrogenase (short-subunit alcohol dehydrogenase family)